ncbi:MAG: hypothetical protein M3Q75_07570, partial [Gemmatimonadota bacterium]|nr:hypothetical protein [Gemmatimonadota bacterium]
YEPSENSFAQLQRESWEMENEGLTISTGMLYDSIEAPTSVGFAPPKVHPSDPDPTEDEVRAYIGAVIDAVRGDAVWLDLETITGRILSRESRPSQSRRFYYNQIQGVEDAAFDPGAVDAATHPEIKVTRVQAPDPLRVGWSIVRKVDPMVVFGDGSKSEDSTGLIGRRLSDGYTFNLGVWSQPTEVSRRKGWLVPRQEVTDRVDEMFGRFNVIAFWFDPSHALDDDGERYWDAVIDGWHREHKDEIDPHFWAVKTGDVQHSILWDMTSPARQKLFTPGVELTIKEIQTTVDDRWQPPWYHDGSNPLKPHMKNARRSPNPWGVSLRKEGRNSLRKIDLATCVAGARMLDRIVQNRGVESEEPQGGWGWSV